MPPLISSLRPAGAAGGASRAAEDVESASRSPLVAGAARLGYAVRGLLYGAMGVVALGVALGRGGQGVDQRGVVSIVGQGPARDLILVVLIAGLAGYALWGFVRAIFDPLNRGSRPGGIADRLGFVWSGLSYAGLLLFTAGFLRGTESGNDGDATQKAVQALLSHPAGTWAAGVAGVLAVGVGIGQLVEAYRANFRRDLKGEQMTDAERLVAEWLGRAGMGARGVIFTMLGWFVLDAAIHDDSRRSHGMGAAFLTLAAQPLGHLLLGLVASGFIALGLHSLAAARWMRIPSRR